MLRSMAPSSLSFFLYFFLYNGRSLVTNIWGCQESLVITPRPKLKLPATTSGDLPADFWRRIGCNIVPYNLCWSQPTLLTNNFRPTSGDLPHISAEKGLVVVILWIFGKCPTPRCYRRTHKIQKRSENVEFLKFMTSGPTSGNLPANFWRANVCIT